MTSAVTLRVYGVKPAGGDASDAGDEREVEGDAAAILFGREIVGMRLAVVTSLGEKTCTVEPDWGAAEATRRRVGEKDVRGPAVRAAAVAIGVGEVCRQDDRLVVGCRVEDSVAVGVFGNDVEALRRGAVGAGDGAELDMTCGLTAGCLTAGR